MFCFPIRTRLCSPFVSDVRLFSKVFLQYQYTYSLDLPLVSNRYRRGTRCFSFGFRSLSQLNGTTLLRNTSIIQKFEYYKGDERVSCVKCLPVRLHIGQFTQQIPLYYSITFFILVLGPEVRRSDPREDRTDFHLGGGRSETTEEVRHCPDSTMS